MLLAGGLNYCKTRGKRGGGRRMRRGGQSLHCGRGKEPTTSVGMGIVPFDWRWYLYTTLQALNGAA